jgi:hypothetical protein
MLAGELVTRANGDVKDTIGGPADNGQLALVDPDCRVIGLHLYDGVFKVCMRATRAMWAMWAMCL